jgi:hypothetical protein
MKVNLNKQFVDFNGNPVPESISDAIAKNLFFGNGVSADNADAKYAAYKLCSKIMNASGAVDLTAEELVLIKQVAEKSFTPGAYGQVIDLLEQ